MDPLTIAMLVGTATKTISGLAQGIGGASKQKKLWDNRPQLGVTAGETSNDNLYRQMAGATEMPGQRRTEEKLGQAYAEGVSNAQQTASSGLNATQSAVDLSAKKMAAIQDLGGMFAEYKAKRMDALGNWNNQKSQNELQRFEVNEYNPWMMKYGEAVGNKQAGFASGVGGLDSAMGMLSDLQGTNSMMKMLKSMFPNVGGSNEKYEK